MYICKECGSFFLEPQSEKHFSEFHGRPVYETSTYSPCCFADYTEACKCHVCCEYISGEYVKYFDNEHLKHMYICENCYMIHNACEE